MYHSLQANFNRRFRNGFSFGVNYVLSLSFTGNTGLIKRRHKREARTIEARHLSGVDPDFAIVDVQAGQGREHVLNHFDAGPLSTQRCAARNFHAIRHRGRNAACRAQIAADEDHARARGCRSKLDLHVLAIR